MRTCCSGWAIVFFLIAIQAPALTEEIDLPVPHLLEYGADIGVYSGASTCGPCSLEMCVAYLQKRKVDFENVKKVNAYLDPSRANDDHYLRHGKDTSWDELVQVAKDVYRLQGVKTVDYDWSRVMDELRKQAPVILSIADYGAIPEREDKNFIGGHFLVVCGATGEEAICQDPDNKQPKVRYPISHLNDAVGNFPMIIGFQPMEFDSKELKHDRNCWWFFFSHSVAKANLPEATICEGRLELPTKINGYSASGRVESFDGRIWEGQIELPRFCLEENQKPLLLLKGRFLQGRIVAMPILNKGFLYQCWVVNQVGNHLLIIQRKVSYGISLLGKPEDIQEIIDVKDAFLRKSSEKGAFRGFFVIRPSSGVHVRKDEPALVADLSIYVHPDGRRACFSYSIKENGQRGRLDLSVSNQQPPYPEEVTPAHLEMVRRATFADF